MLIHDGNQIHFLPARLGIGNWARIDIQHEIIKHSIAFSRTGMNISLTVHIHERKYRRDTIPT